MLQMCVQVDSRLFLYNISFTRCILIRARQWERKGGKLESRCAHTRWNKKPGTASLYLMSCEVHTEISSFLLGNIWGMGPGPGGGKEVGMGNRDQERFQPHSRSRNAS